MNQVIASDDTGAQQSDVQLTLSESEAEQLRLTLPWLLRALADRPTATAVQRDRRRRAHAALERLLSALSNQLQPVEQSSAN
jgi:hypothetical protein